MTLALDIFSALAIAAGAVFFLAGTVALLRFPDSLSRLHALTKADNLGLGLVVLGPAAESRKPARRAQACPSLGARPTVERGGRPDDRRRPAQARSGRVILYQLLDLCLALLVIGVAAWTIFARELFGAVVGYVAYGLILAIVWVRLLAPDVALTEAAIGGGATGVLLVTAGSRLRSALAVEPGDRAGAGQKALAALLSLMVAGALAAVVLVLPEPPPTLAPEAKSGLEAAGLGNPVTAVLIVYRAFDTMLEKAVLLLAVVGVWSIAPDRFWGGAPAPLGRAEPDRALIFLARMIAPIGVLIGLHIFWVSADEPGGAFQAGAILAAMWIVVMMARLADPPRIASRRLRLALVAGPAVFVVVALLGPFMGGSFLSYPPGFVKPVILFVEVFMLLSIAASIPMLIAGPPLRKPAS